jgi:glutamine amidotransferase
MNVVIIDYDAGNTRSVQFALNRLGVDAKLSANAEVISSADKVIFPGVGNAAYAMKELKKRNLIDPIRALKQDTLGVCLGMQLMCSSSEEGDVEGLNIFNVRAKRFNDNVKVPHIGWNTMKIGDSKLFEGIEDNSYFYFVHSYYVPVIEETVGLTNYGLDYSASIQKDNFYACQFHPEKSWKTGEKLIKNFLEL